VSVTERNGDLLLAVRDDAGDGGDRVYLTRHTPAGWSKAFVGLGAEGKPLRSTVTPALAAGPNGRLYVLTGDPDPPPGSLGAIVARHARGPDYHEVVAGRLRSILSGLKVRAAGLHGRVFVDTAPVMEKVWAQRAGLGWIGRNGLLVQTGLGSFTVLGGIAIDAEVEPDRPAVDGCGDCRKCVDACPASAITGDRLVDVRACLSRLTSEADVPPGADLSGRLAGRSAFGCDLCQEACPVDALSMDNGGAEEKVAVEEDLCIGCGQCAYQCPEEAIVLKEVRNPNFIPGAVA